MKNTRKCPKCGSGPKSILRIPGSRSYDENSVPAAGKWIPITRLLRSVCGYSEEWIESPRDIALLRRLYPISNAAAGR